MKSKKYIKHRKSKYEYPTRVVKNSVAHGNLIIGRDQAESALRSEFKRPLNIVRRYDTLTQWVFCEARES